MKFVRTSIILFALLNVSACALIEPPPRPPTKTVERINATPAPYVTETPVPPPTTRPPTVTPTPAPLAGIATQFEVNRALDHARVLSEQIGARPAGSENAERAAEYIFNQLDDMGYSVEWQNFRYEQWININTILEMTSPTRKKLEGTPLFYSPAGEAEAEIVAVPNTGAPADYAKVDAKGRIVLVQRGTLAFLDKVRNAERAGAVAVLIYNNAVGSFRGTLSARTNIPVIALSGAEGKNLLDLMAKGPVAVHVASDTRVEQQHARNVVARKSGATDRVIVLGGHYDSVETGKGAVDNGSGIAVMLELARLFSKRNLKSTLEIIAFDAEELGLYGSRHFVDTLPENNRKKITAMLNFDMLGGGSGALLVGGDGRAGTLARELAQQVGIAARNFSLGSGAGSDHQPFQAIGIDTIFFSREYGEIHTEQDTFVQIKPEFLLQAGRVGALTIEKLDAQ